MQNERTGTTPAQAPSAGPQAEVLLGIGQVMHKRLRPAAHAFRYPSYFLMLPMRAWRAGLGTWLPRQRFGLITFDDRDHGDGRRDALAWFEDLLKREGVNDADGEVWLHTFPRVLGYAFKPVSFWYAHRKDGSLAAVVAEVNNTFGERHCYVMRGAHLAWGVEQRADKVMHVSPFCSVDGSYRFRFMRTLAGTGRERTVARIDLDDAQGCLLQTSVSGVLEPCTTRRALRAFFGMPLMTWGVILRIHWQALRLALKRVPFLGRLPSQQASERLLTR